MLRNLRNSLGVKSDRADKSDLDEVMSWELVEVRLHRWHGRRCSSSQQCNVSMPSCPYADPHCCPHCCPPERSEGPMQFAGSASAAAGCIGPSARKRRGPQDDRRSDIVHGGHLWKCPARRFVSLLTLTESESDHRCVRQIEAQGREDKPL